VLNPLKSPYALAEAASRYLPAGQDLLLYRVKGEIQAFYCNARGREVDTPEALIQAMHEHKQGLIVMRDQSWDAIKDIPAVTSGIQGRYRMGSKDLIWVAFDLDSNRT